MATCYSKEVSQLDTKTIDRLEAFLPREEVLADSLTVQVSLFDQSDPLLCRQALALFNDMIEEGLSWPFADVFSEDEFLGYFCGHIAVSVMESANLAGMFYVKPNFPDRCSGICNGGFLVHPAYRGRGVGKLMGRHFLRVGRDAGFSGSLFNLVFANNEASLGVWRSLGFAQSGKIPRCASLKVFQEFKDCFLFILSLCFALNEECGRIGGCDSVLL